MREIKFRAWHKTEKKMYEVFGIDFDSKEICIHRDPNFYECDGWIDFKHIELMQYTGLKDKNGKEIYEGDIVDLENWKGVQQICFIDGAFCLADEHGEYVGDIHYIHHAGVEQAKVIGSIYENPELVK